MFILFFLIVILVEEFKADVPNLGLYGLFSEASEVPNLFSYHLEKRVVYEIEETQSQFFEDLGIFLKNYVGSSKEIVISEQRVSQKIMVFQISTNPPIFISTIDSKKPKIDDYLSKEEYDELPLMKRVEYSLRNKIVTNCEIGNGFILHKLTPSGDLQWKKHYQLTEDEVGEIYLTKILPSTSSDYANVFGKIIDLDKKISFFHLTVNTIDGSIEKTESYSTKKKENTEHEYIYDFCVGYGYIKRPDETEVFRTFGRNKEHFYLFPKTLYKDGHPFMRANFRQFNQNPTVQCFEMKDDVRMEDIFWNEDEDKLIFRLKLGRDPLFDHVSDYYFDEENHSFKPNHQTEFDFSFLFGDEVENEDWEDLIMLNEDWEDWGECYTKKRRKGETFQYKINLCALCQSLIIRFFFKK